MLQLCSGSLLRGLSHQPLLIVGPWPLAYDPPHTLAFSSGHLSSWLDFAFSRSGIEESSFLCAQPPLLSIKTINSPLPAGIRQVWAWTATVLGLEIWICVL